MPFPFAEVCFCSHSGGTQSKYLRFMHSEFTFIRRTSSGHGGQTTIDRRPTHFSDGIKSYFQNSPQFRCHRQIKHIELCWFDHFSTFSLFPFFSSIIGHRLLVDRSSSQAGTALEQCERVYRWECATIDMQSLPV